MAAVQQNGCNLSYVKEQTPEICLAAVQQNGLAIEYVVNHTREICLAAVQQNSDCFDMVKKPTREICLAAGQHNHYLAAVQQNSDCFEIVKKKAIERNKIIHTKFNGGILKNMGYTGAQIGKIIKTFKSTHVDFDEWVYSSSIKEIEEELNKIILEQ